MARFQTSLEYLVFLGMFIVGGVLVFRILYGSPGREAGGKLPIWELNTSAGQLMGIVGAQVILKNGTYVYNVTQEFNTNKTIFGMRIWPYAIEGAVLNYSVTFLATGEEKKIAVPLSGGSLQRHNFQDAWFDFRHISYSDGVVVYEFRSSVMEEYLS